MNEMSFGDFASSLVIGNFGELAKVIGVARDKVRLGVNGSAEWNGEVDLVGLFVNGIRFLQKAFHAQIETC